MANWGERMNAERARQHLEDFLSLLRRNRAAFAMKDDIYATHEEFRLTQNELLARRPLVLAIAEELDPGIAERIRRRSALTWEWEDAEDGTVELLGLVREHQAFRDVFTGEGPTVPRIVVHASIWLNVKDLWAEGRFADAVRQATAFVLGTSLASKLEVFDITGPELVSEAFSLEPPRPGRSRLRLPGVARDSEDWESGQRAMEHIGIGCVLAVRALTSVRSAHLDEQLAQELLGALSIFTCWVEACEIAR